MIERLDKVLQSGFFVPENEIVQLLLGRFVLSVPINPRCETGVTCSVASFFPPPLHRIHSSAVAPIPIFVRLTSSAGVLR
jgi:hypothetical protein